MAAGGPGHGLQRQLSPGVLCPGWGVSASPVLALLMLFGLVFRFFFYDVANLLEFFGR